MPRLRLLLSVADREIERLRERNRHLEAELITARSLQESAEAGWGKALVVTNRFIDQCKADLVAAREDYDKERKNADRYARERDQLQEEVEVGRERWNDLINDLHLALNRPAEGMDSDELVKAVRALRERAHELSYALIGHKAAGLEEDRFQSLSPPCDECGDPGCALVAGKWYCLRHVRDLAQQLGHELNLVKVERARLREKLEVIRSVHRTLQRLNHSFIQDEVDRTKERDQALSAVRELGEALTVIRAEASGLSSESLEVMNGRLLRIVITCREPLAKYADLLKPPEDD